MKSNMSRGAVRKCLVLTVAFIFISIFIAILEQSNILPIPYFIVGNEQIFFNPHMIPETIGVFFFGLALSRSRFNRTIIVAAFVVSATLLTGFSIGLYQFHWILPTYIIMVISPLFLGCFLGRRKTDVRNNDKQHT